jgi:PhnB protein
MPKKTRKKAQPTKRKAAKAKPRKSRKIQPVPKGYHSVIPYIAVKGAAAAIEFYKKVLGAKELTRFMDGERVSHAEIRIGDSHVMLADENPEMNFRAPQGSSPVGLMVYLPGVDATAARAVAAGATIERPVADQFYGDRLGTIIDPYGHRWHIATHVEDVSAKEMQKRMQAMQKQA